MKIRLICDVENIGVAGDQFEATPVEMGCVRLASGGYVDKHQWVEEDMTISGRTHTHSDIGLGLPAPTAEQIYLRNNPSRHGGSKAAAIRLHSAIHSALVRERKRNELSKM